MQDRMCHPRWRLSSVFAVRAPASSRPDRQHVSGISVTTTLVLCRTLTASGGDVALPPFSKPDAAEDRGRYCERHQRKGPILACRQMWRVFEGRQVHEPGRRVPEDAELAQGDEEDEHAPGGGRDAGCPAEQGRDETGQY